MFQSMFAFAWFKSGVGAAIAARSPEAAAVPSAHASSHAGHDSPRTIAALRVR
jgi:hypothetical protein